MFNLITEIAAWRKTILETETCTENDVNELQSHLNEEIDQLKIQNLTEQEAFLVAACRIGKPAEIAAEFTKVNPGVVCKNHIFWACTGILSFMAISRIAAFTARLIQVLLSIAMPKIAAAGPGMIQFFENKGISLPEFISSRLNLLASNPDPASIYVPAYLQIACHLIVFAILAAMLYKFVKNGQTGRWLRIKKESLLTVAVITLIALQVCDPLVRAWSVKFMSVQIIGRTYMITAIFTIVWSAAIPIMLAIMIKKFRPQKPVLS